ncbi:MAG: hypothetical protein JJU46_02170 [Balneolaceae bacterium]|nr:hypothetical protein [Balneolaceae bacterium]MCH8549889.1 hypothetical protein [Balneolaceae bacterium]
MAIHFQFNIQQHRSRERRILNSLLAILTGILTLSYPSFLYLIAGGYLIALGLIFIWVRVPAPIAALPILAGGLIFLFPELIPYTFAAFLGFFGLILLLAFQFAFMGFLTLIFAVLIVMNPDSVAYLIAGFLLLYGASNLIRLFQDRRNGGDQNRPNLNKPRDDKEIIIE